MKLLPILAATLMQEAHAVCDPNLPIFKVTCHEDLIVQLEVDEVCLGERYPDVKVTELIISKTGATECKSCTDASPQWIDPLAPDYCNPEEKFAAYDYLDLSLTPGPVTVTSPNLWFKAGNCGSSMEIVEISGIKHAKFATTIYKPPTIDPVTSIVSQRTILATDIVCDYPRDVNGVDMFPNAIIVVDGSNQGEKIEIKEVDDIEQGLFGLSVYDDTTGQTITSGTAVSVGDEMRISVTASDTAILDFYLSECTATNGKDPSASDYKSLKLIEDDGCMVDHSAIWPSNAPASPNPGQYIDYRQFGFASISGTELTLEFVLTCTIRLGTAPTNTECATRKSTNSDLSGLAGRKRRQTDETEFTQTTEYTIKLNENTLSDTHGDIVVAHDGQGKGSEGGQGDTSDAVTNAVALIAGTAIMLL